MDTIRVGLIGCGVIGRWHAQAARETAGVELVAVADLVPERADAYAREFGVKETYGQGDELIDRAAVDLVVLALPACGRTALGLHAFAAGRHLLTEKPVAMNAAE
ncbi:MAG: Gfo/Idh/MocA family oxidoreductase, partial [Armatimonadetes bacterium]|nr:Gfo/Idh/MocA family oxidoreductase [Armatimonadota bacterium]